MSDIERQAFEKWAGQFDHDSNEWEDMFRDEIFAAGMQAARASEGGEAVDVVFDGLPGPDGCRFIEVESPPGTSVRFGEWVRRDDGFAALRFARPSAGAVPEGWNIERESSDRITIDADGLGYYVARMDADRIADIMLYALANDLLTAAPTVDVEGGEVTYQLQSKISGEWEDVTEEEFNRADASYAGRIFYPHNGEQGDTGDQPVDIALDVLRSVKARIIESHADRAPSAERAITHVFEAIRIEGESRTPMGYNPPTEREDGHE